MKDSDSNFPKKLRITVFENFTFQRIRLGNEIFFNFSDFELKLSQRLGFCIKLLQWVGLSGFFFKKKQILDHSHVLFYFTLETLTISACCLQFLSAQ